MQFRNRHKHTATLSALALFFLAATTSTPAQVPKGDLFFGYTRLGNEAFYPNVPGLNGLEGTGHLKVGLPFLGVEGDVAYYGTGADASLPHSTTFLFGPRATVSLAGIHLFAHALAGGEHSSSSGGVSISSTNFAYALGGGLDFPLLPFFAWRVQGDRIVAPAISPSGGTQARFTTGLVFRF